MEASRVQCPHCGATISTARFCSACGRELAAATQSVAAAPAQPRKRRLSPLMFTVISVALIGMFCIFLSVTGLGLKLLNEWSPTRIEGMDGHLQSGGDKVLVARDQAALDTLRTAGTAQLADLDARGQVFLTPAGTRILVLDAGATYRVQILDGEHVGAIGYVPAAFVTR
jgi:hypothetical protein